MLKLTLRVESLARPSQPRQAKNNWNNCAFALLALRFQARLSIIFVTNGLQTDYGISLFVPILQSKAQGVTSGELARQSIARIWWAPKRLAHLKQAPKTRHAW